MTMSEVGLDAGFWGDLYIVMGDNLGKGEFTFRLHYKPLIRWLWLGGILMALGALCSAINLKRKTWWIKKFIFIFYRWFLLLSYFALLPFLLAYTKYPKQIASALINKPVPEFYQANLLEPSQIVSPKRFPEKAFST